MITSKQVSALKYLVGVSMHGTPVGKQLIWFLLDQSKGLTREVCVTLTEGEEGFSADEIREIAIRLDGMTGRSGTTHMDQVFRAAGSEFSFSLHFGGYDIDGKYDTTGMFAGHPVDKVSDPKLVVLGAVRRYTFWLARGHFSDSATLVPVTRAELEKIDLSRPGLYPELENQQLAG